MKKALPALVLALIASVVLVSCDGEVDSSFFSPSGIDYSKYSVGGMGQAGGLVFYDIDADNATGNADGLTSAECGWRFIEAAPEDLTTASATGFVFGCNLTVNEYLDSTAVFVNGTSTYDESNCTLKTIGSGKANTEKHIEAIGEKAYQMVEYNPKEITGKDWVIKVVKDYSCNGYEDWFLPSIDELHQMFLNLKLNDLGNFSSAKYWSSSEAQTNVQYEWGCSFDKTDPADVDLIASYFRQDKTYSMHRIRLVRYF